MNPIILEDIVDFPTPPLPEATAIILLTPEIFVPRIEGEACGVICVLNLTCALSSNCSCMICIISCSIFFLRYIAGFLRFKSIEIDLPSNDKSLRVQSSIILSLLPESFRERKIFIS